MNFNPNEEYDGKKIYATLIPARSARLFKIHNTLGEAKSALAVQKETEYRSNSTFLPESNRLFELINGVWVDCNITRSSNTQKLDIKIVSYNGYYEDRDWFLKVMEGAKNKVQNKYLQYVLDTLKKRNNIDQLSLVDYDTDDGYPIDLRIYSICDNFIVLRSKKISNYQRIKHIEQMSQYLDTLGYSEEHYAIYFLHQTELLLCSS